MIKRKNEHGRKWKKSLIYFASGKKVEEELTYDYFEKHLDDEWAFRYGNQTIDIATHYDGKKYTN